MGSGRRLVVALAVLAGALVLALYDHRGGPADEPMFLPAPLSMPLPPYTPPPTAPPGSPVAPIGPPCTVGQLLFSDGGSSEGAEQVQQVVVFVNLGRACTLRGSPTLVAVDTTGRQVYRAESLPAPPVGPAPADDPRPLVNLAPGQAGSVQYSGVVRLAENDCPPYRTLMMTLPNTAQAVRVPGNDMCRLDVAPVVPDTNGQNDTDGTFRGAPGPVPAAGPPLGPPCAMAQLNVSSGRGTVTRAGRQGRIMIFRNAGQPCTLTGYPGVTVTDGHQHPTAQAVPELRGPLGGLPATLTQPPAVPLATGASASALLDQRWAPLDDEGACPRYTEMHTSVPGGPQYDTETFDERPPRYFCAAHIHPFVPGRDGGATAPVTPDNPPAATPPAPAATAPPCLTFQLDVTRHPFRDREGIPGADIVLTNRTGPTCTVYGYPRLVALDLNGRPVRQAEPHLSGIGGGLTYDGPIPHIQLNTGESASAAYDSATDQTTCTPYTQLRVTPPDNTQPTSLPAPESLCGLTVHPLVPGDTGESYGN